MGATVQIHGGITSAQLLDLGRLLARHDDLVRQLLYGYRSDKATINAALASIEEQIDKLTAEE